MRTVCGLDVHKASIFMCILDEQGKKSEKKFGVSTREIKSLCATLKSHRAFSLLLSIPGIKEQSAAIIIWALLSKDECFDNQYIQKARAGVA